MLLTILGIIDAISAILLFLTVFNIGYGFPLLFFFGIILIVKALYSLAAKSRGAGLVDFVSAILLIIAGYGFPLYYILTILFGILILIKGLQGIFAEIFS